MNKICITGACGFIGFHLSKALLEFGEEVVGIDNLNDYYDVKLKQDRLSQLMEYEHFKFEKIDILDKQSLDHVFKQEKFDYLYHLAAQAGVRYSITNPEAYLQTNVVGFFNLLELCRTYPVKHFIYASSSSVYGNINEESKESDNTNHPVSFYAATKKSSEILAYSYSHLYQIPMTGLRFFTVYGPWGRPDMAYYKFTEKILKGETIEIYNEGNLYRDFTYIEDVIDGLMKIKSVIPSNYALYNIGNNHPEKLMDFVRCLERICLKEAHIKYSPMQEGDVYKTSANIDSIHAITGFTPKTNIEEGLKKFVEWYIAYTGDIS
jgi:UDP-glucuronate 4-epimerase